METDLGFLLYVIYGMVAFFLGFMGWEIIKFVHYIITFNSKNKKKKKS